MPDDTIPLCDGDLPPMPIIHAREAATAVRCRRGGTRRPCDGVHICFSPEFASGRVEHVDCPVRNVSAGGFAIEFDGPLEMGLAGHVTYRTLSGLPVHIGCTVRHCKPLGAGRFLVGLKLDRRLQPDELRPARARQGRELAPGLRPRRLRATPPGG
jgi:hypothetical protein